MVHVRYTKIGEIGITPNKSTLIPIRTAGIPRGLIAVRDALGVTSSSVPAVTNKEEINE
jgi:hypothetical protein